MKKIISILIIIIIIIINSCNHNIPIAKIEFQKIKKNNDCYELYFSSDKDLINSLKGYAYIQLDCFFKSGEISKEDYKSITDYSLSSLGELKLISKKNDYVYMAILFPTNNNIGTEKTRKKTESKIIKLINKNNDCLSCAVTAVAFMNTKERYISKTMCLPKVEIRKILK